MHLEMKKDLKKLREESEMAKSKRISVTPNVKKCLEHLKAAVKALPEGELKENAKGAISYLSRTFKGERQPGGGATCPGGTRLIG
jgi:hypothetical protein